VVVVADVRLLAAEALPQIACTLGTIDMYSA
jgi:hypothetical protein